MLLGFSFALFFHLCNGIRHLFWDVGMGFELKTAYASGNAVIAASIALTLAAWGLAYAMRGGLPFDAALEAVTITPARMVGVDDRVGSLEVGKDADLVLWSGRPFELTSKILGVVLNGELVYDARDAN